MSRDDWDNIYKPINKIISILENDNGGKPNKQSVLLKEILKCMFGDYNTCFPEGSPLHESIKTGYISLPPNQGGDHKVSWKNIK